MTEDSRNEGQGYGPFHRPPATPREDVPAGAYEGWVTGEAAAGPHDAATAVDPYGLAAPSFTGRRIAPSPPPPRNRLLAGLAGGLLVGLLIFGTGGWFAGRATAPDAAAPTIPAVAAPSPSGSLGVFEQSQVAINTPAFAGTGLAAIGRSWLPYLASCMRSGKPGGPTLNEGEKLRIRCSLDGMSVVFVEYTSIAARDKARVRTLGQNVDARSLTPGVGPTVERSTPSGSTMGNYVEYAYKLTEGRSIRVVSGIWWDDTQTPVGGYLLAFWKDGLGERWEPMRDLWSRNA